MGGILFSGCGGEVVGRVFFEGGVWCWVLERMDLNDLKLGGEAVVLDEPVVEEPVKVAKVADMGFYVENYYVEADLYPWGKNWAGDLFYLGHNAIRLELHDLQRVLMSMFQRHWNVGKSEVDQLYKWWDGFVDLVGEYFDYEELVFFPWLTEKAQLKPEKYGIHMRLHMKAKMLVVMRKIDSYQEKFLYTAAGERLPELASLLRYISEALCEYMKYEEKKVRSTVEHKYTVADMPRFYLRMEQFVMESDRPLEVYMFFTRHIPGWRHWSAISQQMRANAQEFADAKSHFQIIDTLLQRGGALKPDTMFEYDVEQLSTRLQGTNLLQGLDPADLGLYHLNSQSNRSQRSNASNRSRTGAPKDALATRKRSEKSVTSSRR